MSNNKVICYNCNQNFEKSENFKGRKNLCYNCRANTVSGRLNNQISKSGKPAMPNILLDNNNDYFQINTSKVVNGFDPNKYRKDKSGNIIYFSIRFVTQLFFRISQLSKFIIKQIKFRNYIFIKLE